MKAQLTQFIRSAGIINYVDNLYYYIILCKSYFKNRAFKKSNPTLVLPPPYYLYETFGLNYETYYSNGLITSKWLIEHLKKHILLENIDLLDWGCGPARIVRHLPQLLSSSCRYYGSDYNKKYVKWCQDNIPDVSFRNNDLEASLQFEKDSMDVIYGISIFTHLSKEMHFTWFNELLRVLRPGGVLLLTMHGDVFKERLNPKEILKFELGELVEKSNTKEGHRTFAAFQPSSFVRTLIGKNELLEHIVGNNENGRLEQDVWIIRKNELSIGY